MQYSIKKLGKEDFEQAQALFRFFQEDDDDVEITKASDEYIQNRLASNHFHVLVALQNDTIVGGLTAYELSMYKDESREIFLYEIGVAARHRRLGLATKLIDYLKEICARKGIAEMYVGAMDWNEEAIQLYTKTGGKKEEVAWFVYQFARQ